MKFNAEGLYRTELKQTFRLLIKLGLLIKLKKKKENTN